MSIEKAVRERHEFEDRMRRFISLASVMTNREIELSLSRIADMSHHMEGDLQVIFRGQLLNAYYRLRVSGARRMRLMKRLFFSPVPGMPAKNRRIDSSISDYWIRSISNFDIFQSGQSMPPEGAYRNSMEDDVLRLS